MSWPNLRYYTSIFLDELRGTRHPNLDSRCLGRNITNYITLCFILVRKPVSHRKGRTQIVGASQRSAVSNVLAQKNGGDQYMEKVIYI
jgi:hypothetical protein